jgi:DNA repair ATPase RecN
MEGILGNTLTCEDQQIPDLVDKVVDIQVITYDKLRKVVMRRTTKKRRLTLDNTLLITTEETLLNTENAKTTELIRARMDRIDAMLDREKKDEKELAAAKKEMDHLCHLAKYYQDLTKTILFMRSEFRETYEQFKNERNLFTTCRAKFQEDTLMGLETCKDMHRWYEKAHRALE